MNAQRLAVIVIGRNEGDRLTRCITSVAGKAAAIVYVDSGSSDGSVDNARALGADVVTLDLSVPFTAARARNAGWRRLVEIAPHIPYVQFVDGDCEVVEHWLDTATTFLDEHPEVVVVCGRRRERYPERSIYNTLCDLEWDTPMGEARACGGDAMMRVAALAAVDGYRPELIAGEEPELCVRLRKAGGRIWRLGDEMTLHDAAMLRFGQWWNRTRRAGYAFAWGVWLHGAAPERHYVAQARRAAIWGGLLPVTIVFLTMLSPFALAFWLAYPLQIIRIGLKDNKHGANRWLRAFFLVLGRFPEALGLASFYLDRMAGKRSVLIEYK